MWLVRAENAQQRRRLRLVGRLDDLVREGSARSTDVRVGSYLVRARHPSNVTAFSENDATDVVSSLELMKGGSDAPLRAFVSSLSSELKEHRAYVMEALERAGFLVIREEVPATDDRSARLRNMQRQEDLVVLLAGPTYSDFVKAEYDEARNRGIDVLVFAVDPSSIRDERMLAWYRELERRDIVELFRVDDAKSIPIQEAIERWTRGPGGLERRLRSFPQLLRADARKLSSFATSYEAGPGLPTEEMAATLSDLLAQVGLAFHVGFRSVPQDQRQESFSEAMFVPDGMNQEQFSLVKSMAEWLIAASLKTLQEASWPHGGGDLLPDLVGGRFGQTFSDSHARNRRPGGRTDPRDEGRLHR